MTLSAPENKDERTEEARRLASEFMVLYPTYRIVRNWPVLEHFCGELSEAGLPD